VNRWCFALEYELLMSWGFPGRDPHKLVTLPQALFGGPGAGRLLAAIRLDLLLHLVCPASNHRVLKGIRGLFANQGCSDLNMRRNFLLALSLLSGCLLTVTGVSSGQVVDANRPSVHPGDHLRITVLSDDKALSGEFEVGPDSTLRHPLYNQVKVVGVPLPQLKETIASFLRKFQREPQFEVEPLYKVSVGGEVRAPNILFLSPETTVADAVNLAGGTTDRADLNRVTLSRDGEQRSLTLQSNRSNGGMLVQSGDQITIAATRNITGTMLGVVGAVVSVVSLIILATR
jgi:protein involved in polysaccharide export with SLBB domain